MRSYPQTRRHCSRPSRPPAYVVVTFDGSGNSGQIESITAFGDDNAEVELPSASIELQEVDFNTTTIVVATRTIHETIEMMTYRLPRGDP